jgi:uncharacterized repeat protein (TIGR02543 family)
MKNTPRFLALLPILLFAAAPLQAAPPVVSNLTAAQRTGTKLVDITYDVTADTPTVTITLEIHADGTTWTAPPSTCTGAIVANIDTGTGKAITWNAGTDWNEQQTGQMQFRVTADDLHAPPAPDGFTLIPARSFQMGDQSNPRVGTSRELPVHTVYVSAFFMAKYEVTKALWDTVREWGLTHNYTDLAVGSMEGTTNSSKGPTHPVHLITWYNMVKWCNAKSEKEGLTPCYTVAGLVYRTGNSDAAVCNWSANGYRLPTEAEWEKAARGGLSAQNFPWGNIISHTLANFANTNGETYQTGTTGTHPIYSTGSEPYTSPVGSFAPNGYGLYDMAGNVYEWCWDWYGTYAAGSQTDPRGATTGSASVIRGGSWTGSASSSRIAPRDTMDRNSTSGYGVIGFRVARSADQDSGGTGSVVITNVTVNTRTMALTLSSTPPGTGTMAGAGGYAINASVFVSATPAPGYLFTGWSGDATGTTNPLSVLMDADKTITANFVPDTNDDDKDGLTNYREIVELGTNPTKQDTDGDNVKDKDDAFPLDIAEWLDTDGDGTGDNADTDDDGDGLSDEDESNIHHTDPKRADSDGDGLSDPDELQVYLTG